MLFLNVHLHALVLDGVFTRDGSAVDFHPVRRIMREDVAVVVAVIARRVERLLERRCLAGGAERGDAPDLWSEEAPVLAALASASVDGRVALGPRAGARVRRCGDTPEEAAPMTLGPCHAHIAGFDLHAGLVTGAGQRDRLERLCRYALRPPLAQDRLQVTGEGEIWLTLRHRWADGTTHLQFDPLELLERLAVLTPRPRINLILYYGVLAPRAAWRAALVSATAPGVESSHVEPSGEADEDARRAKPSRAGAYQWAELMRRTFGLDVLACPRCGGRLRFVALIDQASVVLLRHLGLPTQVAPIGQQPVSGAALSRCRGSKNGSRIWQVRIHCKPCAWPCRSFAHFWSISSKKAAGCFIGMVGRRLTLLRPSAKWRHHEGARSR